MCVRPGTKDRIVVSPSVPITAPRTGTVSATDVSVILDLQVSGMFKRSQLSVDPCPSVSLCPSVFCYAHTPVFCYAHTSVFCFAHTSVFCYAHTSVLLGGSVSLFELV